MIKTIVFIENIIYIKGEFTRKKWKTAILLYCFHAAGVLHIFVLLNLSGLETSFYRKNIIKFSLKTWFPSSFSNFKEKRNCNGYVQGSYCIIVIYIVLHVICEYLHELYTLNSFSGSKELNKFIPRDSLISQFYFNLCSVLITLDVSTHFFAV